MYGGIALAYAWNMGGMSVAYRVFGWCIVVYRWYSVVCGGLWEAYVWNIGCLWSSIVGIWMLYQWYNGSLRMENAYMGGIWAVGTIALERVK